MYILEKETYAIEFFKNVNSHESLVWFLVSSRILQVPVVLPTRVVVESNNFSTLIE